MSSGLHQDYLDSARLLSKPYQIHEGALGELVNGDVSHPDKEFLVGQIHDAGEHPQTFDAIEPNSSIEFIHFELVLSELEDLHHF